MFTLILLGFAMAVLALKRRGRALLGTAAAAVALAGALLANMAPDLYYAHPGPPTSWVSPGSPRSRRPTP